MNPVKRSQGLRAVLISAHAPQKRYKVKTMPPKGPCLYSLHTLMILHSSPCAREKPFFGETRSPSQAKGSLHAMCHEQRDLTTILPSRWTSQGTKFPPEEGTKPVPDRQVSMPNSRQTPSELCLDSDGAYAFDGFHNSDPNSSSVYKPGCIFGNIRPGPDQVFFNNCPASIVGDVVATSLSGCFPMSTLSPRASTFLMPTHSLYGVNDKAWSWSYAGGYLDNFFTQSNFDLLNLKPLVMERYKQSPINGYEIQGPPTSGHFHASQEITVRETKRQAMNQQLAQRRASRSFEINSDFEAGKSVRPTVKCDYHSCNKAFARNDSLKRHRRT